MLIIAPSLRFGRLEIQLFAVLWIEQILLIEFSEINGLDDPRKGLAAYLRT
jgi:hypothetical protein